MEGVSFMSTSTGMQEFSAPTMNTLHLTDREPTYKVYSQICVDGPERRQCAGRKNGAGRWRQGKLELRC
jgi:hypothetical protein